MNRNKLDKVESIGFFIAIAFASIVIGMGIMALIGEVFEFFVK